MPYGRISHPVVVAANRERHAEKVELTKIEIQRFLLAWQQVGKNTRDLVMIILRVVMKKDVNGVSCDWDGLDLGNMSINTGGWKGSC